MPPGQSVAEGPSRLTEYADTTTQHKQAAAQRCSNHSTKGERSMAASLPRQRASRQTVRQQLYLGRRARMSHSKSPTECTVHVVLSVLCNAAVVPRSHSCHMCVSVVGVHRSVTTSRIIDPQPNFSRKLLCVHLSESVDESPPASSTTQLVTPLSTQPV